MDLSSVSGVGFVFNSGKTMWVSDKNGSSDCYGYRLFLEKLTGFFVPVKSGVVELASLKMVQEDHSVLESIGELEKILKEHKKDYVDMHRTTEQERDSIEHEVLS
ncbi:SNARE-complex protein Syntaxin-18, N-terminal [Dillenia turbinata]|uniref:SNARE-complex protein Syntaxin-18, N-terminal n=1 Tax=Dillenia turbinata TaxID=194707 RepID=A0AAN8ZEI8_9MAGN